MIKKLTLADVFTDMGVDSAWLREVIEYYKDKPDDYIIEDVVENTTSKFTLLELILAEQDLNNREGSPKIPDAEYYKNWRENNELYMIFEYERTKKIIDKCPSIELLIENKISLQYSPNHIFHDPIDNTIFPVATHTRTFNNYEEIDWSDVRILYNIWRKEDDDSTYYMQYLNHEKLEFYKLDNAKRFNDAYGRSRILQWFLTIKSIIYDVSYITSLTKWRL